MKTSKPIEEEQQICIETLTFEDGLHTILCSDCYGALVVLLIIVPSTVPLAKQLRFVLVEACLVQNLVVKHHNIWRSKDTLIYSCTF